MGNTGSAHNIHNECINSELNSYYTQKYLRRTTEESKKKNNPAALGGWSSKRNGADFKVLPKSTESLKLRATTNGAILQSGGTISFRAKEHVDERPSISLLEHDNVSNLRAMRRCYTLILDGQNESLSHQKSDPPLAEFRRSQTLLHSGYNRTKSHENVSTSLDEEQQRSQQQTLNTTSTIKVNKYNKKRKAPPAPAKISSDVDTNKSIKNDSYKSKSTSLSKTRIYTTNINKPSIQQQQKRKPQLQSPGITPFQRGANVCTSVNSSRSIQHSKLPYRREKSFEAVLLRKKYEVGDISDIRTVSPNLNSVKHRNIQLPKTSNITENNTNLAGVEISEKNKFARQQVATLNKAPSTSNIGSSSEKNYLTDIKKIDDKARQYIHRQNIQPAPKCYKSDGDMECQTITNEKSERKIKSQQSRIPQLKRTFYFGMEISAKIQNPKTSISQKILRVNGDKIEENEDMKILKHNIDATEEEIVDNGILVHVRPTLPRRQPETSSFSPAAAWRNLLEEQQRLEQNTSVSRIIDSPISLTPNTKNNSSLIGINWTPEQDLEDDNDEDQIEQKFKTSKLPRQIDVSSKKREHLNLLHTFSLSLPRDVHLQSQIKSSLDYTEQENSLKAANCWFVPGFNSLQKFKTQLSKNVDSHSNSKCICENKLTNKRNSYLHLQTIFCDSLATSLKNHQPYCELYKTSVKTGSYHNDNWVLHKSQTKDISACAVYKTTYENGQKSSLNRNSLVYLHPKSLSNICRGKHIVYLPGRDTLKSDNDKNLKPTKMTKFTYKRKRQRQETIRENLQDQTTVQNVHKSNVEISEKNTPRFSFQSTVRVLEKRRLAEKLFKHAEIQEAQRLNDLEAMKRVEEDFQRKRAPEKANLRNQLRLHLKSNFEIEEYRSLPLNINDKYNKQISSTQLVSDANNNLFCRAEPDGAVSPCLDFSENLDKVRHSKYPLAITKNSKDLDRFDTDGEESESETQMTDLQLLIEPYLHSIV